MNMNLCPIKDWQGECEDCGGVKEKRIDDIYKTLKKYNGNKK